MSIELPKVFDRAVIIDKRKDIEVFILDPMAYFESIGALEGLNSFNGLYTDSGIEIVDREEFCRGKDRLISVHIGTPYRDACKWILY